MLTPFSLLCDAGSGSHLFEPCRVLTLFAVVDTWEIHGREVTSLSCTKCSSACTVCGVRGSWDVDPPPPSQLLPPPPPPCSSSLLQASSLLLPPPCSCLLHAPGLLLAPPSSSSLLQAPTQYSPQAVNSVLSERTIWLQCRRGDA